jgi:hypothetical protein
METKAFANWTGKDRHLTRDEFVKEWLETTYQYSKLFLIHSEESSKLVNFQKTLADLAGQEWDSIK